MSVAVPLMGGGGIDPAIKEKGYFYNLKQGRIVHRS